MEKEEEYAPDAGVIPLEKMHELREGMSAAEVLELLGPPKQMKASKEVATPTEFFQSLGWTTLDFAACRDLDAVWIYEHDRRKKFRLTRRMVSFVGFRDGRYAGHWQHT